MEGNGRGGRKRGRNGKMGGTRIITERKENSQELAGKAVHHRQVKRAVL